MLIDPFMIIALCMYKIGPLKIMDLVLRKLSFNQQLLYNNQKMYFCLLLSLAVVFASAPAGSSCGVTLCSSTDGCLLVKNKLLTTLPQMNKQFLVSFEFRATQFISGWQSVIHFTENGDCCNVGKRVPAFWVSGFGQLYPRFAVNGNGDYGIMTTKKYSVNEWHNVEFSQELENNKYIYRVKIDGVKVLVTENKQPKIFSNVKVFAADPWYNSLKGSLRNLFINTEGANKCEVSGCSCSDDTEETHQGTAGRCLTKYKGKYFCYVKDGAGSKCPDKKESIRAAKWWSYEACDSYEAPPIVG